MPMLWDRAELILAATQHIHRCRREARAAIDNMPPSSRRVTEQRIEAQEARAYGAVDMVNAMITVVPGSDPQSDLDDINRLNDLVYSEFVAVHQEYTQALNEPM